VISIPHPVPKRHARRATCIHAACAFTVVAALAGCRKERANPAELFSTASVATTYLNRGQLAEAETQFRKLVALAPDDPSGHANLGVTYLRGGRFDEAELALRESVDINAKARPEPMDSTPGRSPNWRWC